MNELTPNWDDLRLFAAIAAEGSLSAAARRLKLSQPTMGRRLQALEERMGAKLLERTGGGPGGHYVLTPKGAELLPLVERMVEAGEAIERARPDFAEDATGTVRVASGPMTIRFIARRLPELLDALPGIEIELYSSYSLDQPVAARGGYRAAQPAAGGRPAGDAGPAATELCRVRRQDAMSRGTRWRRPRRATRNAAGSALTTRAATARACCG